MIGISIYKPTNEQTEKLSRLNVALNKLTTDERELLYELTEASIKSKDHEPHPGIKIFRTPTGLYKIETNDIHYVGGAASTIITLSNLIFRDEASEV